jgi:hypothetical protein
MRVAVCLCALLWAGSAFAQDRKVMDEAAIKAIDYVRENIKTSRCWAKFAEHAFLGLAMLAEGSTLAEGKYSADLKASLDYIMAARNPYPETPNWFYAICLLFLAEVYKKDPSDEIKTKMQELVKTLEEVQESTGGWCHKKGYTYNLAGRIVPDIAMLAGLVVAALGDAKSCGCEVSNQVIGRAMTYAQKISDGQGMIYGTNNSDTPDHGNTRIGLMMMGLHFMNQKNEVYAKASQGLVKRVKEVDRGHSFPPLHFFSSGVGTYLLGQFGAFKGTWMNLILQRREADGSIWLWHTEKLNYEKNEFGTNTISTAVMAILLQLEKGNVFKPAAKKDAGKPGLAPEKPKNPFS